ncbi:MAG TPA: amidohydrolase family protein [Terracidiphilus sp.]|nr:amidohydrolase family protein [Terracidiphilus sp.]
MKSSCTSASSSRAKLLRHMIRLSTASGVLACTVIACQLGQAQPQTMRTSGTLTVDEGTNMALTVSPDRNTIMIDLQGMLFTLPIHGGKAKQVTPPVLEASHPSWSPKAELVALQSYSGGTFHIWTMKPDGTDLHQITTGRGDDREPAFSPDGKEIAFSSDRAFDGSYDIWSVELATGSLKQWTSGADDEYEPSWSPDGKELAFVDGAGIMGRSIQAVDRSGNHRVLADLGKTQGRMEAPSWSPDGKTVAWTQFSGEGFFMASSHVMVGGAPAGKSEDAFPFPAAWLSANEFLYTGSGHIYRYTLATKSEAEVPFTADIRWIRPSYKHKQYDFASTAPRPVLGVLAPALSPDGEQVAFGALNQLWVMKIGAKPQQLTHGTAFVEGPQWSPDGKMLAYSTDTGGVLNLYIRNMQSGDVKQVSPSATSAQILPAWSPDGKWLAFQDQSGVTLVVNVAIGATRALTPALFDPGRPSWSADGRTIAIAAVKSYTRRYREGTNQIAVIDVASGKMSWFEPAPYESISARGEDGPVYSPNGKALAFIMDDLLYTMPVDAEGHPTGTAKKLGDETADAPTWSGDSQHILFESNGKLRMIEHDGGVSSAVPVDLTWHPVVPHQRLLIHAGRFWKGEGPDEQKDVDILIVDNRIESVLPHAVAHEKGVDRVVDATQSTVLPGLWENHVHPSCLQSIYYGDRMGRLWLSYGITELRDLADATYRAEEQREALDSGARIGPRLFPTGEAIDGERVYYSMMIPTTSEAQLQRELERLKAFDFDMVKLYVRLPYAWQMKGTQFAHEQMGVVTGSHYLLPAVSLGNDLMSHISATSRTGYAYSRSYTMSSYSDVDKMLSASGMATISTTFNQALYADDPGLASNSRFALYPPWEQERLKKAIDTALHTDQKDNLIRLEREESTVAKDFENGGLILAGTDSPLDVPATSLHLNLRAQVKFGMKPWQALETATSMAARAWHVSNDLGTLERGKVADLIIVSGDPLVDIKDAANVQYVMKNGTLMPLSDILAPFAAAH